MVKICVFDTETTDKPPFLPGKDWNERTTNDSRLLNYGDLNKNDSMWGKMLPTWPSIIQLSYIIYDIENPSESKIYNKYIDIPDSVIISEGSFAIHHINKEIIQQLPSDKKTSITNALTEFLTDVSNPEVKFIVGHNIQFDRKMIISELLRLKNSSPELMNYLELLMNNDKLMCTMNDTAPVCNLQMEVKYKDKKTGEDKVFFKIKSPKLIESYFHYFGYNPSGEALHDAIVDVILCLRVFMKYKYNIDVCGTNKIITDYVIKISPKGYVCPVDVTEEINAKFSEIVKDDIATDISKITLDTINNSIKKAGGTKKNNKKKGKKVKKTTKKSKNKKNK